MPLQRHARAWQAVRRALWRAELREKPGPFIIAGTGTHSSANVSKLGHLTAQPALC